MFSDLKVGDNIVRAFRHSNGPQKDKDGHACTKFDGVVVEVRKNTVIFEVIVDARKGEYDKITGVNVLGEEYGHLENPQI